MKTSSDATRTIQSGRMEKESESHSQNWKSVVIGGFGGVLMGAGAVYAADSIASRGQSGMEADGEHVLKVAKVSNEASFGEAFSEARSQVGAGGVFRWHGKLYGTYTRDEWGTMSNEEKEAFASRVKPEVSAEDVKDEELATASQPAADYASQSVTSNERTAEPVADNENAADESASGNDDVPAEEVQYAQVSTAAPAENAGNDTDVQLVSTRKLDLENGFYADAALYKVNGEDVVVVDVDNDDKWDVAIADLNHNGTIEQDEVIDLQTGQPMEYAVANQEPGVSTVSEEHSAEEQQMPNAADMQNDSPAVCDDMADPGFSWV